MGDEEKATEYINLKVAEVNIFAEVNYYGSVVQFKMKKVCVLKIFGNLKFSR